MTNTACGMQDNVYSMIVSAMSQPHRKYHTMQHIEDVLNYVLRKFLSSPLPMTPPQPNFYDENGKLMREVVDKFSKDSRDFYQSHIDRMSVQKILSFAILMHDYVYEIGKTDNEIKSAQYAKVLASGTNLTTEETDKAIECIIASASHDLSKYKDDPVILTFLLGDLHVLFGGKPKYEGFAKGIREEYGIYSDEDYIAGRTKVLDSLRDNLIPFLNEDEIKCLETNIEWEITEYLPSLRLRG